ncbi:glycosyltransferase [Pseudomonas sp. MAG002Y]|uniref:glycosyltransferase n=1 Tax=Pseudomonas sp. MAG002Y TaxID=2678690 RepID=UPI001C6086AD|nr:glycosyltransferase [Pseudomonas sp. MAG002Y]MBW5413089.1 glycosyltransferase [Pseudomonas sp. MAG002Y]
MHILHVFKTYLPDTHGGIEQVIRQMCRATTPLGVENQILTLSTHPQPQCVEVDGTPTYRVQQHLDIASTGMSLTAFQAFNKLARQADLIHYHFPWPFMDLMQVLCRPGLPYVVSYHSDIVKQKYLLKLYQPLMHHFLKGAERIIVATEPYRKSSEILKAFTSRTEVIPYGLDESSYPKPMPQLLSHWRQRLGPRYLLFVGVLRYYKGLHLLLDALAGLDYPIAIVGDGPEGTTLQEQALRLGLKNCHFLGRQDEANLSALYAQCETFVFPSHLRSEAFGIALLEGAMYGKPLLCCDIGSGMNQINLNGETGLCVPPTVEALRMSLQQLWNDSALRDRFGIAARKHFLSHFQSWQMGKKLEECYQKALDSHQSNL